MFFWVFAVFMLGFSTKNTVVDGKPVRAGPPDKTPTNLSLDVPQEDWAAAHSQRTKNCWPWKISKQPRLVIVVRWYIKQNIFPLLATLESSASAAKELIAVKIVDTNPIPSHSHSLRRGSISFSALKRQVSKSYDLLQWLDIQLLRAPVLPPELENVYGYGQTEWVLQQLQDDMTWDHIMFTNGDNTYSSYFLQETLRARKHGHAVVGFDFVSRYSNHRVKKNVLKWKHSDLGSMIFHRGTVDQRGKGCSCGLTFQAASKPHGWYNADAGLLELAQNCSNKSQVMIHAVLFHHQ